MGGIVRDDIDCGYDDRLARLLKRRSKRTFGDEQRACGPVDGDYRRYLNTLGEFSEWRHSMGYNSCNGNDSVKEDDIDPQYKMFLENLKQDGRSYVLEVVLNKYTSLSIKYEADHGSNDELEPPTVRKLRKESEKKKIEFTKDLRDNISNNKVETRENLKKVVRKDMRDPNKNIGSVVRKERMHSVAEKGLNYEPVTPFLGKEDEHPCEKPFTKRNQSCEAQCERETEADTREESYQMFLSCLKMEGDCLVFAMNDDTRVMYEPPDVSGSDDSAVQVTYNQFEVTSSMEKDGHQCCKSPNTGNHSLFREKLMVKLREPFDRKEYQNLWGTINERTSKYGRHRDLRGDAALKSYKTDGRNPSYLERYSSFRSKINAVKSDQYKLLNLMRGFFFWLENLAHEDAFQPWMDRACLEVLPRNC